MLPAPGPAAVWTAWRPDAVAIVTVVAAGGWYALRWRDARAQPFGWPARRPLSFAAGLILLAWSRLGFPGVYGRTLMWVWTVQVLTLLLVVPVLLMAGQPIALTRAARGDAALGVRIADSAPVRVLSSAMVSPLLVPLACAVLFFSRVGDLSADRAWAGSLVAVVVVALGALVARPLTDLEDRRTSVAIGVGLAIGMVELVLDAVPGLALRLATHPVADWFVRDRPSWSGGWPRDQQLAGNIAWSVAELLDLPFLVIVFIRWWHADRREAQDVDALLGAQSAAGTTPDSSAAARLWWLDDPRLKDRFER